MTPKYKKVFSYYGGKSKIAHKYPAPVYDVVIEPFAGGASYSLLHHEHDVILNDKDPITASVWAFLLNPTALDTIHAVLPKTVAKGQTIDELVSADTDPGLINLIRGEIAQGCLGATGYRKQVTTWGERDWHQVLPRLEYWIPRISHWSLTSSDYLNFTFAKGTFLATWFVDPPYANAAGADYRTNDVDYAILGQWCKSCDGQVIVCENEGATWLPFKHLTARAGAFTGRDSRAKASGNEVVWVNQSGTK